MNQDITTKKTIKICVALFSTCFIFFNASVLKAQVTGAVTPDADSTDTDTTTDTTTDTNTPQVTIGVPDTIGATPEEESSSSGGGGGGGALAGLLLVGAVVAIASNKKKAPSIQKTLVYDKDVSGRQIVLLNMTSLPSSTLNNNDWKKSLPEMSMQLGSYTNEVQPYSFMNIRVNKMLASNISLSGDIGSRMFQRNADSFGAWQRLSMSLNARDVFAKRDTLSFIANYAQGDNSSYIDDLRIQDDQLQSHESVFLEKNTRFKLAYSKPLVENQQLRFQLSKNDSISKANDAQHYLAQFAWQLSF
jgi:hypothetical protein